ncbi:msrA [Symbiodinium sp. CCMP2592]|nr:msrA [Symbiodinium sp. CCMP2592]
MAGGSPIDRRWPRQVAPDLEREASRLLRWAQEEAWGSGQEASRGLQPNPASDAPLRPNPSPAQGSSVFGGPQEDPWEAILATGDENFVEVPTVLLERLRRAGEAQLAEIAELRGQLAQLPYVEDEIHQMEQELAELQTTIVVNTNEIELRNMEAESIGLEAARLEATKVERKARLESLNAQAGEIEFWLDAAGHAPVGPEVRCLGYKVMTRLQSDAHRSELADFFHRLDPAGPAGGRLFTEAEVQAAAANPKSGLPRAVRGQLLDVLRASGAEAGPRPAAEPETSVPAVGKPGEDSVPAVAAATASPDDAEQSDHSNPEGSFTLPEWRDFFREEGSFSTEEWMEVTGALADLTWSSQKMTLVQLRSALSAESNMKPALKAKVLELLADESGEDKETAEKESEDAEEDDGFTKEEWMEFFKEDGDINKEELKVLDGLLEKMDVSGDGRVSSDEIKAALARKDLEMPEAIRSKLVEFMKDVVKLAGDSAQLLVAVIQVKVEIVCRSEPTEADVSEEAPHQHGGVRAAASLFLRIGMEWSAAQTVSPAAGPSDALAVDIEALGQALQVVEQKNLEYMNRIHKQETREQQLKGENSTLQEEVESIRSEIDALRKQLEGDEESRTHFERARSQLEMTIESLEVQVDTLKKALSTAERANEQLQDENRTTADRCRETADKVYALMDSLRLNQVELKKLEAENASRDKKLLALERQTQNLQAKITMEIDAKVLAEQERKEAEQEAVVLKKKNKKIEDNVTVSQGAQEKAEKEISELNDRVGQLQTQNAYLASRIDGQEEEKSSLKVEIRKVADKASELSGENSRLRDEIDSFEEKAATTVNDTEAFKKELEYIKREDVLDEAGRQRPILIQSTESDLLEKLQVNEFLYEAQQARNPVPPMIEKIAQLLAMLHEGQQRSDAYLGDLSKSNALVSAMRQRNMSLFGRTQMFESFKSRALMRYVMNMIEGERIHDLHLDGLSFGLREIKEMLGLFTRYECFEQVYVLSLIDNGLDDDCVNTLLQVIFQLPYMRSFDLRRNCFTTDGIKRIEEQLRDMDGVTAVIKTVEGAINVHSGNQLRMSLDVSEQLAKEQLAKDVDFTVDQTLSHAEADPFLETAASRSEHLWTKTAAAAGGATQRPPQKAVPDVSSVPLEKPTAAPAAPAVGGPPVGLGGPGNLAALNKKMNKSKTSNSLPDPKKRAKGRAKAGPGLVGRKPGLDSSDTPEDEFLHLRTEPRVAAGLCGDA